jgi:hypothetical protein
MTYDITVTQGIPLLERYTWATEEGRRTFDGFTARSQVRLRPGWELILDLTPYLRVVDGVEVDGVSGQALELSLPAAVTATLRSGGRYDVLLVSATTTLLFLSGAFRVVETITRV